MRILGLSMFLVAGAAATASAQRMTREGVFHDAQGKEVGRVVVRESGGAVRVQATIHDLAPGRHGIHIHETGRCEAPGFESAGGHLNPHDREHGRKNRRGYHLGDLGNITVAKNGRGSRIVTVNDVETRKGLANFLAGGRAVIIHADPDDEMTDPSGNSGARIACAVVTF